MKKSLIVISVIVVFLIGGFALFGWFSQRQLNAVMAGLETQVIEEGTLSSTVGATGTVRANQSAYLIWKTSGQVDQVWVKVGDSVTTGELLANLDDASLPAYIILAQADLVSAQDQLDTLLNSSLQQAEALKAVEEAEKALEDALNPELAQAQAQAAIAAAETDLDSAQTQLAILTKPVSQTAIDQAHANFLLAENKLNDLQDQIAKTEQKMIGPFADFWESKKLYRNILEALNMQLPQLQLRYEEALRKYNRLLEPPDPLDVAVAQAAVFAAQAQLQDANLQYERIKDGTSPADLAVLEARLADAQREYERVKDGAPREDVSILETRVAAAQATLQQTQITAPFAGTITQVESQSGDQVSAGTLAFRLDDLSTMLVDLDVSEIDINLLDLGQDVVLTFDSILAKEYLGKIVEIAPVGNTDRGIPNFTVTVELLAADEEVRSGMTSEASIITGQVENALLVPNRAIRLLDGERVVYVLREAGMQDGQQSLLNSLVAVPITLGATSDLYSEVLKGDLVVGDKVILNPPSDGIASAREGGMRVEINP